MKYKMIAGLILLFLLGFVVTRNLVAQTHVSNKSYDVMLSTLLSHSVEELSVDSVGSVPEFALLDARERKEFEVSHLQGATWVGYDDFDMSRLDGINKDMPLVVYCSVGYRSEKIAEKLKAAGYTNVYNLYGGIFEWVNTEKPVVDMEGQETKSVHAYSKSWGVWLSKGKKIYN
jgi:rhodanese-related sulfurtransferase